MKGLKGRVLCDLLHVHSGPLESYGQYSYINCVRCGALRQPMPRRAAERRYGPSENGETARR